MLKRFYLEDHDKEVICQEMQLSEAAFNQALSRATTAVQADHRRTRFHEA